MTGERRRIAALAIIAMFAVVLAAASLAFACARLATVALSRESARPGADITAVGRNFNSNPAASTVQLRFNSRSGRVLWEGRADSNGKFRATFDTPNARPGYYVIVATQSAPGGRPAAGTPGRDSLRIRRARASRSRSSRAELAPVPVAPPSDRGSGPLSGAPAVPALAGAALLLLLTGGAFALLPGLRRGRGRLEPAGHGS